MKNESKSLNELLASMEPITEDQQGMLMGGFTEVAGDESADGGGSGSNALLCHPTTNNCNGGNCITGCGGTTPNP